MNKSIIKVAPKSQLKIKGLPNELIELIYDFIYDEYISSDYRKIAYRNSMFRVNIKEFFMGYNFNKINIKRALYNYKNDYEEFEREYYSEDEEEYYSESEDEN